MHTTQVTDHKELLSPSDIIDHQRYPIDEEKNLKRQALVSSIQQDLRRDGCAVVPSFLSEIGLEKMLNEAQALKSQAYYSPNKACNVYLNEGDKSLPANHPKNKFLERSNGFITADLLSAETAARTLFHWQPLAKFLADCLGKSKLHIYQDPISNMIVNVGKPNQQFNWHFDTNEFTITMLLKPAQSGGHFEYVPGLRSQQHENYQAVTEVLDGDKSRVKRLALNAGDLQFFLGRFSLHRVTKNTGAEDRLLLIMSFTETANMIGSLYRVKDLYGKVTDAHLAQEQHSAREDGLLD